MSNYPCERCGVPRTKEQGGTVFTVCDDCWDATTEKTGTKLYTRAEVLALMERVREACRKATLSMEVEPLDHAEAVYAVDVARLLDSDVDPEAAWTKGNIP